MFDDIEPGLRHDWTVEDVTALFNLPFTDLLFQAQTAHRQHFAADEIQISQLLSIKTGGCPEDCGYCNQSAHFDTGLSASKLMPVDDVLTAAKAAKEGGAQRFCMGAAWRELKDRDVDAICDMVEGVKAQGLETCMTLGMLTKAQADRLADAGLDYYNHNIDTSEEHYANVISTRSYDDRLETLEAVRGAGMKVCCGGILGMGESREDRVQMIRTLATMADHPGSVPINALIPIPGTPLEFAEPVEPFEFVRTIAVARITMPASTVRIAAGREAMSEELQTLCFMAGANSIFYGETLLTAGNPMREKDEALMAKLGLKPMHS